MDSATSQTRYPQNSAEAILGIVKTERRKTSFEVDFAKVERAKKLLGTTTLTETVDAALDEVIALQRRRELIDLLFGGEGVELDNAEVTAGAWR